MGALLLLCRGAVAVQCSACLLWQQIAACLPLPAAAILSDPRGFSAKPTRKLAHGRKREDLVVPPAETCRPPGSSSSSSSTSTSTQASAAAAAALPASAAAAGVLLLLLLLFVALRLPFLFRCRCHSLLAQDSLRLLVEEL